jgi:hypothetical protein
VKKQIVLANNIYKLLCEFVNKKGWAFINDDENLSISFSVFGNDLKMEFCVFVDYERELVRLYSPMEYKISESKLFEGAIMTCIANFEILDGSFDYDVSDGSVVFRMTASYDDNLLGDDMFDYIISYSMTCVDRYNDIFLAIDKGYMTVYDFLTRNK